MSENRKIVFYDGDCGFCNKTVQFVLNHEKNHVLYFASLQSEFSIRFFEEQNLLPPDLSTFYFWNGRKMFSKSDGVLRVVKYLKLPYPLLLSGYILPGLLRDSMYDFIAKRRHRLAAGFCALPDESQKSRFLD